MSLLKNHKTLFIVEGILFIILGALAIILPGLFTLAFELMLGWIFVFGGLIQGYRSLQSKESPGWIVSLISSLLYVVVGALLLFYPLKGVITLTFLLALFFFLEGIAQIVFAISVKPMKNWGWLILNGILALIIAFIIWSGWPGTVVWVLGLLVGINFLFYGFSRLFIANSK